MRAVLQRVGFARVTVDSTVVGEIGRGILALVGFLDSDTEKTMDYMLDKMTNLRIFEDEAGKMNRSLRDVGGALLIVPNFTLYGDARHGRRPGYSAGAAPAVAAPLYERLREKAGELPLKTAGGVFQADMQVELLNEGPVTLLLDSERNF